ncbi:MAG: magnesium and cobalt transport protein CorA [Novosphingobium sp.]
MTIIAARRYRHGRISLDTLDLDGPPEPALTPDVFDWIGLHEPDAAEMEQVQRKYGLHPLAVEDALNPRQLPKVEVYGSGLFVVARTAQLQKDETGAHEEITYGQTAFFVGPGHIVSVRFGSTRAHLSLRAELESKAERLAEGPDYVLHAVLDFIVDGYLPLLDQLEEIAQEMEEAAIDVFPEQAVIRRIFRLRRQLRRFERVIGPMEEMCARLVEADLPCIDPAARIWFRDVLDHVRRAMARMRGLKETLATIVETASLLEQHRQGEMTRALAAWAAILAVPTAIAGIYGMNFTHMPELEWRYGYFAVWGVILLICGSLWLRFRRIGWL